MAATAGPIRVLVCDLPLMAREMIEAAIAADPDVALVASVPRPGALRAAAAHVAPEVVLVGLPGGDLPPECAALLEHGGGPRVVGVDVETGEAYLYRSPLARVSVGETSPREVVAAIRRSAAAAPR